MTLAVKYTLTSRNAKGKPLFAVSFLDNAYSNPPDFQLLTSKEFFRKITNHDRKIPFVDSVSVKREQNVFLPAEFLNGDHQKINLGRCNAVVLDVDEIGRALLNALLADVDIKGLCYFWYTSANHTHPEYEPHKSVRLRLVFLLNAFLSPGLEGGDEYRYITSKISEYLGDTFGCKVDANSFKVTQPYTYGIVNPDNIEKPERGFHAGKLLNVAGQLKKYHVERQQATEEAAQKKAAKQQALADAVLNPVKKHTLVNTTTATSDEATSTLKETAAALDLIDRHELKHLDSHACLQVLYTAFGEDARDTAKHWYDSDDFARQWHSVAVAKVRKPVGLGYIFNHPKKNREPRLRFLEGIGTKKALRTYLGKIRTDWSSENGPLPRNPHWKIILKDFASPTGNVQFADNGLAKYFGTGDDEFDLTYLWLASRTIITPAELHALHYASQRVKNAFNHRFAVYREYRLSFMRLPLSEIMETIDENHFMPEHKYLVNVSAMGTKKSENIIPEAINYARARNWSVAVIGNRIGAIEYTHRNTDDIAKKNGYPWKTSLYSKLKSEKEHSPIDYLMIVVNSLAHQKFEAFLDRPLIVIMDEFAQILADLTFGKFEGAKVDEVYAALRKVLRSAKYVVCMDANATQFYIDKLKELIGIATIHIVAVPRRPRDDITVTYGFDHDSNPVFRDHLVKRMANTLTKGKSFMAAFDSRKRLWATKTALETIMNQKNAARRKKVELFAFTSDPTDMRKRFLKDTKSAFDASDGFLFSPALTSGVSSKNAKFEDTFGIYRGDVITPVDIEQQLARGRPAERYTLALTAQYQKPKIEIEPVDYANPESEAANLHGILRAETIRYRHQEKDHSLRTLLFSLEERDMQLTRIPLEVVENLGDIRRIRNDAEKTEVVNVVNAHALANVEYQEDMDARESGAIASRHSREELEAYEVRSVFRIRHTIIINADATMPAEPITEQHVAICRRTRNLMPRFWMRACLFDLMDSTGRPKQFTHHTNGSQRLYRTMTRLWTAGLNSDESGVRDALTKGEWSSRLDSLVAFALKASKSELLAQPETRRLIPVSWAGLKSGSHLTDEQAAEAIKKFKEHFVPPKKDAELWLDSTERWQSDLQTRIEI